MKVMKGVVILLVAAAIAGSVSSYVRLQHRQLSRPQMESSDTSEKKATPTANALASTSPPATISTSSQAAADATKKLAWWSYTNSKYRFSIKYPCDSDCQLSTPPPIITDENGDARSDAINVSSLQTQTQLAGTFEASIAVSTFTAEFVKKEYDLATATTSEGNPGSTFTWSLASLRAALQLSVSSSCALQYYDSTTTFPCRIVSLAGQKAVEVINDPSYRTLDATRDYFFNRGEDLWLDISEDYSLDNRYPEYTASQESQREHDETIFAAYLSGKLKTPPAWVIDPVDAAGEVLATLRFY
jgi:hypothetical protein